MRSKFIIFFLLFYSSLLSFQVKNIVGPISEIELIEPKFSPNNNYISATTPGFTGIIIFSFPELKLITNFDYKGIGYGYKWNEDENFIICRQSKYENKRKFYKISLIDLNNKTLIPLTEYKRDISVPLMVDNNIIYFQKEKKFTFNIKKKLGKSLSFYKKDCISYYGKIFTNYNFKITNQQEILLAPKTAPNGDFLIAKVAGGELKIFFQNGKTLNVGNFEMATISKDGKYIIMAKTKDDGYVYISSKLYIYDIPNENLIPIYGLDNFIPINPDISKDNRYIIFEDVKSNKVYYCELVK